MKSPILRKAVILSGIFFGIWILLRYFLPLFRPFLIAALLALAAEPLVRFFHKQWHFRRGLAAAIGVSIAFAVTALAVLSLAALLLRELSALAGIVPDLEVTALQGLSLLQSWLLELSAVAPSGLRGLLGDSVNNLFSGSTALLDRFTSWLLGLASGILSHVPDSAIGIATTVIAAYMISSKLPAITVWLTPRIPAVWHRQILPALKGLKDSLWGWLRAQFKLTLISFLVLTVGFLLLQVRYAPAWAAAIALVDAIPILGTGTVLVPWSIVCFLQGEYIRAALLLGIWAAAALTRSVMEPRLVGKQLGLDPLATLVALYAGYKLWGILGMLLAPLMAVTVVKLAQMKL